MRPIMLILAMLLLPTSCADGQESESTPEAVTITGLINVPRWPGETFEGMCSADTRYTDADVEGGMQVVVRDANKKETVGLGSLNSGQAIDSHCEFQFVISGIPGDRAFYAVSIGGKTIQYARTDLNSPVTFDVG